MSGTTPHRNLILCSDGTGNSAGKGRGTNVWRIYEALARPAKSAPDWPIQLSIHDDGVGTSANKLLALLGGAFGFGLARNVRELYTWLARNYQPGDQIFLFGFSRGAFTVRCLAGMIGRLGVPIWSSEEELDARVREAWSTFKWCQTDSDEAKKAAAEIRESEKTHRPPIRFIGIWDTVDAYGLPFDSLKELVVQATQLFNRFRWTRWLAWTRFHDTKLSEKVLKACHALAIDDERVTFHPVIWDESGEGEDEGEGEGDEGRTEPRIEQVWFPGMHSDVGGGYPRGSLALVSLDWIMAKAWDSGLRFDQGSVGAIRSEMNWLGPMHDSRRLGGIFYRYGPRKVEKREEGKEGLRRLQVHASVPERIHHMGGDQLPEVLPPDFRVVYTRWEDSSLGARKRKKRDYHKLRPDPTILSRLAGLHRTRGWLYLLFVGWALSAGLWFFLVSDRAGIPAEAGWGWLGWLLEKLRPLLPGGAENVIHILLNEPWWTVLFLLSGLSLLTLHMAAKERCRELARQTWRPPPPEDEDSRPATPPPPFWRRGPALAPLGALSLWAILGLGLWGIVERGFTRPQPAGAETALTAQAPSSGIHASLTNSVVFRTDQPSLATGIHLREGERYRVQIGILDPWLDDTLAASPVGIDDPAPEIMGLMAPFRRDPGHDWFVLLGSVGSPDADPFPLAGEEGEEGRWVGRIGPLEDGGELFVFVNDAVSYFTSGGAWTFYRNNHGRARISVELVSE